MRSQGKDMFKKSAAATDFASDLLGDKESCMEFLLIINFVSLMIGPILKKRDDLIKAV